MFAVHDARHFIQKEGLVKAKLDYAETGRQKFESKIAVSRRSTQNRLLKMHARIGRHTHTHTYAHAHTHTHARTNTRTHTHARTHTHTHTHTPEDQLTVQTNMQKHTRLCIQAYVLQNTLSPSENRARNPYSSQSGLKSTWGEGGGVLLRTSHTFRMAGSPAPPPPSKTRG